MGHTTASIMNQLFSTRILKRVQIIPEAAGPLAIAPLEARSTITFVRSRAAEATTLDALFTQLTEEVQQPKMTRQVITHCQPAQVAVRSLPPGSTAGDRTLPVGRFHLSDTLDRRTLKVGDEFTWKVTVAGNGYLGLVDSLLLSLPESIRLLDLHSDHFVHPSAGFAASSKTYNLTLVCEKEGSLELPPASLVYFDPENAAYQRLQTNRYTLTVVPGTTVTTAPAHTTAPSGSSDRPRLFILFSVLVAITVIAAFFLYKRRAKRPATPMPVAEAEAPYSKAFSQLDQAKAQLDGGNQKGFALLLKQALLAAAGEGLPIPPRTRTDLQAFVLAEPVREEIITLTDACDLLIYAPVAEPLSHCNALHEKGRMLLTRLQQEKQMTGTA